MMGRRPVKYEQGDDGNSSGSEAEAKRPSVSFTPLVDVQSWRVWVGHVPSSLCLHEPGIRQLFEPFGSIQTITVHHDALSSGSDGYMFLEFASESAARSTVEAVSQALDENDTKFEGMHAKMAVARGKPRFQADSDIVDLLLGRRQANALNHFSQHSFHDTQQEDEDALILQSLSQRATRRSTHTASTGTSTQRSKLKKRKTEDSGATEFL